MDNQFNLDGFGASPYVEGGNGGWAANVFTGYDEYENDAGGLFKWARRGMDAVMILCIIVLIVTIFIDTEGAKSWRQGAGMVLLCLFVASAFMDGTDKAMGRNADGKMVDNSLYMHYAALLGGVGGSVLFGLLGSYVF